MPKPTRSQSAHIEIDHSDVPVRLFTSDFMEFFTHISPVVVLVIWGPVSLYFLISSILAVPAGGAWLHIPGGLLLGIILWSFTEYTMHRFVFHFHPRNAWQERAAFLFHGVHHYQPQCKTRLVMPLPVSVPLSFIFFGLFHLVFDTLLSTPQWMAPSFAGFILGYLAYDMTHYATHHFPMRQGFLKFLKRYHMQHHYKTPDQRFGVSSPVWDLVFGTYPR